MEKKETVYKIDQRKWMLYRIMTGWDMQLVTAVGVKAVREVSSEEYEAESGAWYWYEEGESKSCFYSANICVLIIKFK